MPRVNITTSLPGHVRDALSAFASTVKIPMSRVIEDGIALRLGQAQLPADVEADLKAFLAATGMSRGEVLELALRRFFDKEKTDGR